MGPIKSVNGSSPRGLREIGVGGGSSSGGGGGGGGGGWLVSRPHHHHHHHRLPRSNLIYPNLS